MGIIEANLRWAIGVTLGAGGDDTDARAVLRRADPLVRALVRRRLQREIEALLLSDPRASSESRLMEAVAGRLGVVSTRSSARPPMWWPSSIVVLVVAALIGLFAHRIATAPAPFSPDDTGAIPERADAYQVGGRPLTLGAPGRELFGPRIAELVIALDRHARDRQPATEAELERAIAELLSEKHRQLVGDQVFQALRHLTESCRATLIDGESVQGDVDELNQALMTAGLAYHLDDSTLDHRGGTTPLLYSHLVERVRIYDVPGSDGERVLWLRRLDDVNYRSNLIGSTHRGASAAVIRRDLVDDQVFESLLPVLARSGRAELLPAADSRIPVELRKTLEERAAAVIRLELVRAGVDADRAEELATLLGERDRKLILLRERARAAGYRVALPTGYRIDLERYRMLEPTVGGKLLRALEHIDDTLASAEMAGVYRAVRDAYVRSVELHEIQHRLDYRRDVAVPADLVPYLGYAEPGTELGPRGRRLVAEYSAYLASIAGSEVPFAALIELSQFAFRPSNWGSVYADTAVAVFQSLARALELEHSELIIAGSVDRAELARLMLAILERPAAELKQAAQAAWERGFGSELPRPVLRREPAAD